MGKFDPETLLKRIESIRNDPSKLDDLEQELRQECKKGRNNYISASSLTPKDLKHYFHLSNTEKTQFGVKALELGEFQVPECDLLVFPEAELGFFGEVRECYPPEQSEENVRIAVAMLILFEVRRVKNGTTLQPFRSCPATPSSSGPPTPADAPESLNIQSTPSAPVSDDKFASSALYLHSAPLYIYTDLAMGTVKDRVLINGKASIAVSYDPSSKPNIDTVFMITEIKPTDTITSKTWVEVAAYMSIIRSKRLDSGKPNSTIFGCFTDSLVYYFLRLDSEGRLHISPMLDFTKDHHLIYTYFVRSIQMAREQAPETTPDEFMFERRDYPRNKRSAYDPLYTHGLEAEGRDGIEIDSDCDGV